MNGAERPLMRTDGTFRCSSCFYFTMAPTCSEVTLSVPYCNRRGRQIGWNPLLFMCGDYGAQDGAQTVQSKMDWRW